MLIIFNKKMLYLQNIFSLLINKTMLKLQKIIVLVIIGLMCAANLKAQVPVPIVVKDANLIIKGEVFYLDVNDALTGASLVKSNASHQFTVTFQATTVAPITNLVTTSQGAFQNCPGLVGITFPSTLTAIGQDAFRGCINLKSIDLPDGLTIIAWGTFLSSGLTSIVIPASVNTINDWAFYNCPLTTITFKGKTPPTINGTNVFSGVPSGVVIKIPPGADLDEYVDALAGKGLGNADAIRLLISPQPKPPYIGGKVNVGTGATLNIGK